MNRNGCGLVRQEGQSSDTGDCDLTVQSVETQGQEIPELNTAEVSVTTMVCVKRN